MEGATHERSNIWKARPHLQGMSGKEVWDQGLRAAGVNDDALQIPVFSSMYSILCVQFRTHLSSILFMSFSPAFFLSSSSHIHPISLHPPLTPHKPTNISPFPPHYDDTYTAGPGIR